MRNTVKALATAGLASLAIAGTVGTAFTAHAEPTSTPADSSLVAVGSDTIQSLADQFQQDYAGFYSYDATPAGSTITPKSGCDSITRPNGSGAGISALAQNARPSGDSTDYCLDLARSSRVPSSTDPTGLSWIALAEDAVTYTAESATNVPSNLSTAQLTAIYECNNSSLGGSGGPVTENEIGGKTSDQVVPVIPQSSSGTRSFFLASIGVTSTPGQANSLGTCVEGTDDSVEENEGTNPVFSASNSRDIVFPFSVAVYLQRTVFGTGTSANNPGPLKLKSVNKQKPVSGTGQKSKINTRFPYTRDVFFVTRNAGSTSNPAVPQYLQFFLGDGVTGSKTTKSSFICSSTATADYKDYGFLPLGSNCGKDMYNT